MKKKGSFEPKKPWGNPGIKSDYFGGSNLRYKPTNELVPKKLKKKTTRIMKETEKKVWQGRIDDHATKRRSFKWSTPWRPGNSHCDYLGKDHPGDAPSSDYAPEPYVDTLEAHLKEAKKIEEKRMRADLDKATKSKIRTISAKGWVPNGYAANNYDFDEGRKRHTVGGSNVHGKY
eukprot:CAMPEP_0184490748 /NCGR_PEP_ID=MMETSP0113_2-20130426/18720_1 /TAXON_ID=91329 /ORGANISM="Norrisiella sphaerica, Strain BC52" /LENGTH=174 /DNA_ID=CAMNT_0026874787 /DNA_START=200 /DNA_END=724 /DNA_ORIENTATION=-